MKKLLVALIILLTVAPVFALNTVELGAKYYANPASSRALFNADIYVGEPDLDPEVVANQKTLSVLQENGNVVAVAQPISTGSGGVPLYNGSYVTLLVEGDYSIKVLDSVGSQIYYVPNTSASATGATFEDWVISTTYGKNAFVVGSDDRLYYSLAGGNIGNDPTSTLGFWQISSNFEGFGSNSRHDQYAGDLGAILNNSIYNVNATSVTNEPVGLTAFGFIHTMMHVTATTNGTQILYSMNSGDGKIWIRHRNSSAWGAWIIVYTETTIPSTLNSVVIDIGDWDMDADATRIVGNAIALAKVRSIDVMIRSDGDGEYYPLSQFDGANVSGGVTNLNGIGQINLSRLAGGFFDGIDFDSTPYNRGWVTIWHID